MFERSYTTKTPWNAGSHLGREVMAVKEHVQMAEMAKRLQQAHMDWDRAVKVVQLKSQVQLGLAEGREQSFINSIRHSWTAKWHRRDCECDQSA